MKKILQLNATANWGSTGKIAEYIGLVVQQNGWQSYIAYGRHFNPSKSNLIKVGNKLNVYNHYFCNKLFDREGLCSTIPTKKLISQISEIKPDIIHIHNIHDHWLNYEILFSYLKKSNIPIVWTFHDCWSFTGGCTYFDQIACTEWETQCSKCCLKKTLIDNSRKNFELKKKLFTDFGERLVIVPVSHWIEDFCKKSFLSTHPITMIHNGIDVNQFKPTEKKTKSILGVALPWSKRKGLDDMVKLRETISPDIEINIIGLDDKQLKQIPDGINGIKRTQNLDELIRFYSKATAFINPTYSDNFPTVNLEALACGTPVITYNTGGSPEAIDKKTGIVVEKGNLKELSDSVNNVLSGKVSFPESECRNRAVSLFNKDLQFKKYFDLYKQILS